MKTLLILAYECAPYHRPGSTIGAQRPFQFAKHLPAFGWRSIVLCCDFKSRYSLDIGSDWRAVVDRRIDEYLENGVAEQNRIVIPLPSLKHGSWIDSVWHRSVTMDPELGTFSIKPGLINGMQRRLATLMKLLTGDHSESWQPVAKYAGEGICAKLKIDMIMAEHSPDAAVFAANALHRQLGTPWVIDFRDPMMRDMKKSARWVYKKFSVPKFSSVAGTINVNAIWAEQDSKLFGKKSCVILNGFDPDDFTQLNAGIEATDLVIGYFGSVQNGQDMKTVLHALQILPPRVKVKLIYRGNQFSFIKNLASELRLSSLSIDCRAAVPRAEALSLMASCDVLLLLSLKSERDKYLKHGLIPGKTFEYFALRKPILVVNGDDGILDALIIDGHVGKIGCGKHKIVDLLEEAYSQKEDGRRIWNVSYDAEFVKQFTRKKQTETLVNFMDSLLGRIMMDATIKES